MEIELLGRRESSLDPRNQSIGAAIVGLYEVFSQYKLRPAVPGCHHCVFPGDNVVIHSRPLRELSAKDLQKFSFKALTTWGDEDDLRHFLPRLLELLVVPGGNQEVDSEIVTGKLSYGKWNQWPVAERAALNQFFAAYWNRMLGEYPCSFGDVGQVLCTVGCAVDDLNAYLSAWFEDESPPAVCHLSEFILENIPRYSRHQTLVNSFWGERTAQVTQVLRWLQSPALSTRLEKLFFVYERQELQLASALSEASIMLTSTLNWTLPADL